MRPTLTSMVMLFTLFVSCQSAIDKGALEFVHPIEEGPKPWSQSDFDREIDQFSFAIISDLNGGERPGIFTVAVAQINLLRPDFVMTVGDLIDGGSEDRQTLQDEWQHFDERAAQLRAPIFHVGGNHDLTNVVMREVWEERYGSRYYHFIYKDVLFLVLDSEDYSDDRIQEIYLARANAIEVMDGPDPEKAQDMEYFQMPERRTGEISSKQSAYFEEVLKTYPDVRWTLLFMHKPTWQREDDHGLSRIENALADRPYTAFNGHFHAYSHTVENGADYIILGTTGGSQNPRNVAAFDHLTFVTMTSEGPVIANLRMDGILDKTGEIPMVRDGMCFQASNCGEIPISM